MEQGGFWGSRKRFRWERVRLPYVWVRYDGGRISQMKPVIAIRFRHNIDFDE